MEYTLITGASGGIGYEISKKFAEKGDYIILVARTGNKLQQIAQELQNNYSVKTQIIQQDLSLPDAAEKIFIQVKEWSLPVDNLVNNAGFYIQGSFSDTSWEKEQELIQLQCINHTKLVKLFLPEMLKKNQGRILNVCSTGSFLPGPYNAIYCASKSFFLSFSEALSEELAGTGIRITALCPGGTNTPFQNSNKRKLTFLNPLMEASVVATKGYNALMKGKRVIVPGISNKIQILALRFLPRWIVARLAGMYVHNSKYKMV
jgi:short-subunit dehydrogenase